MHVAAPLSHRRSGLPWAGPLLAAVALAVAMLPSDLQSACALLGGQPNALQPSRWPTLWTAQFVHWGWAHAGVDAFGLLLTGLLAERMFGAWRVLAAALAAAPLLSLGILWLEPGLASYRGASGLVVLLGSAAWAGLWRARGVARVWLVWVAVALAVKVGVEVRSAMLGLAGSGLGLPAGVQVAWSAHVLGLALGVACGALLPLRAARFSRAP